MYGMYYWHFDQDMKQIYYGSMFKYKRYFQIKFYVRNNDSSEHYFNAHECEFPITFGYKLNKNVISCYNHRKRKLQLHEIFKIDSFQVLIPSF